MWCLYIHPPLKARTVLTVPADIATEGLFARILDLMLPNGGVVIALGLAQCLQGFLPGKRRIGVENLIKRVAICQVFKEDGNRYASAGKDGGSTEDFGVNRNKIAHDITPLGFHDLQSTNKLYQQYLDRISQ